MKSVYIQLLFILNCIPCLVFSQSSEHSDEQLLTIHIKNIQKPRGELYIALYKEEKGFRDPEKAYMRKIVHIKDKNLVSDLGKLPAASYAVAVFQDLNGNGKIDLNWVGIPTEPYGFSNNPKIMFGPPSFSDAAVHLSGKAKDIEITLK